MCVIGMLKSLVMVIVLIDIHPSRLLNAKIRHKSVKPYLESLMNDNKYID